MTIKSKVIIRDSKVQDSIGIYNLCSEGFGSNKPTTQDKIQQQILDCGQSMWMWTALIKDDVVGFGRVFNFSPALDAPDNSAPAGFYLTGLIVKNEFRRQGIGHLLTHHRIQWISQYSKNVYYFVNARNNGSLLLHKQFGFKEITRDFSWPGVTFEGGVGILMKLDLNQP